ADGKEIELLASCVAIEYRHVMDVDDLRLNGRLTWGEITADNGGARIALMELQSMLAEEKPAVGGKIEGYTPEQRFFLGFGRVWCEKRRPEFSRMLVSVDPHSPGKYRVNGVVQNMPEFQKAWGCKAGQPMVAENACRVWYLPRLVEEARHGRSEISKTASQPSGSTIWASRNQSVLSHSVSALTLFA